MADIYVDSVSGNDSNNGATASTAYKTLSAAITDMEADKASDWTVYLTGTFREDFTLSGTFTGTVEIFRWPGQSKPVIRGDVLPTTAWTQVVGNRYSATSPSASICQVVWEWDENVTSTYRHFGHLVEGSGTASDGEWVISGTTVEVDLPAEAGVNDPDGLTGNMGFCLSGVHGFGITTTSSVHINGVDFYLWCDDAAGNFQAIQIQGGSGHVVEHCVILDAGFHSIGIQGAQTGFSEIRDCVCCGCGKTTGNNIVFYSSAAGSFSHCRLLNTTVYLGGLRTVDATTALTGGNYGEAAPAFFAHADNAIPAGALIVRNCEAIQLDATASGAAFGGSGTTAKPTDLTDYSQYPIRVEDCVMRTCPKPVSIATASGNCYYAFRKCDFKGDLDNQATGDTTCIWPQDNNCGIYMESCSLNFDTGTSNTRQIFRQTNSSDLVLINCSVYTTNATAGTHGFWRASTLTNMICYGNVFQVDASARQTVFIQGDVDSAISSSLLDFQANWYDNIGSTTYSGGAANNAQSEWETNVDDEDLGAIYDVDPGFTSATDLSPSSTSQLRTRRRWLANRPFQGFNDPLYNGYYGAYQYRPPRGRGRHRLRT